MKNIIQEILIILLIIGILCVSLVVFFSVTH